MGRVASRNMMTKRLPSIAARGVALCVAAVMLTGCAALRSGPTFTPSKAEEAAVIKTRMKRDGIFVWANYELLAIDSKYYSPGLFENSSRTGVKLDPGEHEIVVAVNFNNGTGVARAVASMRVQLQPRSIYQVDGEVDGVSYRMWMENVETQEKVSMPSSGRWSRTPIPITVVVPAR